LLSKTGIWSAPAKRSGDGALDPASPIGAQAEHCFDKSKAPSPLRFAGALQIKTRTTFSSRRWFGPSSLWMFFAFSR